ncbi:MAG: hypothetical protein GF349_02795 [Candidatus Magasanikbacteria bacterium]|nr:hypothetical protein [Candidatus Magasanikbacteria bacterium]
MKVIFSGGGTLGPVTPLIAIYEILKDNYEDIEFLWVGTKFGPEKKLITKNNIEFKAIYAGKLRRYLSLWNIVDIFKIIIGFIQSFVLIWKEDPDICISAGGYVSVPLHYAAWLYGAKTWIHQQDVKIGLTNSITAPIASQITTALKSSLNNFPKRKTVWLGNPVRRDILKGDKKKAIKLFNLDPAIPTVFATGGGTGSLRVNQIIVESVQHLKGVCQIIHLSGRERPQELVERAEKHFDYYQVHKFFSDEMKHAYAVADVVVSRGGFGTITEVAALAKPSILIPKPGHQIENVKFLEKSGSAILLNERTCSGHQLAKIIKRLLKNKKKLKQMGQKLNEKLPLAKDKKIIEITNKLID